MNFDFGILDFIQSTLRCPLLDRIMPKITMLGDAGILWILVAITFLILRKTRTVGIIMAVSLLLDVTICNLILKPLIARPRPFDVSGFYPALVAKPTDYSFPSGHTAASFAAVSALFFGKNKLWIPSLVIALLIAFSRLYLYVHYPTDVIAGLLLGILCGYLAYLIVKRILILWNKKPRPI